MPTINELWGKRPLSELAAQVGIPFRRLEAYVAGTRQLSPDDRAALAAFFSIDPAVLNDSPAGDAQQVAASVRRGTQADLPPVERVRAARPAHVPPPNSVVTTNGSALARVTGTLQNDPVAAPDSRNDLRGEPRFWLLELLVPHQPLRGAALYPPIVVRCAVHRRQFDPFRWLERGDKVVLTGTAAPRSDHLYLFASTLSTPRADRLAALLAALRTGDTEAEAGLQKLLGDDWRVASQPAPASGVQATRPTWSPAAEPPHGPHGRVQLSLIGQLQADPAVELDEATGGTVELRMAIAPARDEGRLPVVRYAIHMRLRTLRDYRWLQRGDSIAISGDIARLGSDVRVEATTIQLPESA